MQADVNALLLRRYLDQVYNSGNLAAIDELVSPELRTEHVDAGEFVHGPAGLKALVSQLHTDFPDLRLELKELSGEGQRMITRITVRGAYEPPQTGIAIFELIDGKVVVDSLAEDLLGRLLRYRRRSTGPAIPSEEIDSAGQ